MGIRYFSDKIVKWYLDNRRPLPWRDTKDPYRIWLSEVILQQTRVAQGLPYYQRFVETYPDVTALARAGEQQVLRSWQGLGYYTRARNLHKCAKMVAQDHKGIFPSTFQELQKLPGVGNYTAAAIASFAFDETVAVVDGNVFRVLSRIYGIDIPVNSIEGKNAFSTLANKLISRSHPALHNQAIMEFGAICCTPTNPGCNQCPFQNQCIAFNRDLIGLLPVKIPRAKSTKRYFYYVVVEKGNDLLMKRRAGKDIWHGLFDFVLIEKNRPENPESIVSDTAHGKWFEKHLSVNISKDYKHILTHQTIHCRFILVKTKSSFVVDDNGLSFYSPRQIAKLPKPVLISRFLEDKNKL